MRIVKVIFLILVILLAEGCVTDYIKNRIPPPQRVDGGILFRYENKAAKSVNLCGNFNDWCGTKTYNRFDPSIGIMKDDDKDGIWEIIVPLPPGRYQYKFVLDNGTSWVQDPNNPLKGTEDGIENSMIIIDK